MADDAPARDIRTALLRLIEDHPGLHLSDLARRAGISPKLAEYHLHAMERSDLVTSSLAAQTRHYFLRRRDSIIAVDAVGLEEKRIWPHLRHPIRLHLAAALLRTSGLRNHELAHQVGLSRPATSYHLMRMKKAEILDQDASTAYRLRAPALVQRLLERHRPPPDQVERLKGLLDRLV